MGPIVQELNQLSIACSAPVTLSEDDISYSFDSTSLLSITTEIITLIRFDMISTLGVVELESSIASRCSNRSPSSEMPFFQLAPNPPVPTPVFTSPYAPMECTIDL